MTQPPDPDAQYRARFDELEFQREIEEAAEQLDRNTRSLADVFVEYMERGDEVEVRVGAHRWSGSIVGVGSDFVSIDGGTTIVDIALSAVSVARVLAGRSTVVAARRDHRCESFIARLRELAGASAGLAVEIGGINLAAIAGELRAVAETHVEVITTDGEQNVAAIGAIGFVSVCK